MTDIKIFEKEEFGKVRVIEIDNEPWFIAKEIASILGYGGDNKNSKAIANAVVDHVDNEDAMMLNYAECREYFVKYQNGDPTFKINSNGMKVINESGVYSLIMGSKLPTAKKFKHWVTSEVLPSIRRHGVYMKDEIIKKMLSDPDTFIKLITQYKEERERQSRLQEQIEDDKPKVLFADSVAASQHSILVGELAKLLKQNGYETGSKRLFAWLRENGYLIKGCRSDYNMPTQKSMELGLFEIKESTRTSADGTIVTCKTPKVTGKGQIYFINKLCRK